MAPEFFMLGCAADMAAIRWNSSIYLAAKNVPMSSWSRIFSRT